MGVASARRCRRHFVFREKEGELQRRRGHSGVPDAPSRACNPHRMRGRMESIQLRIRIAALYREFELASLPLVARFQDDPALRAAVRGARG